MILSSNLPATEWGVDAVVGGHIPLEKREHFLEELRSDGMTWLRERSSWPTGGEGDRRELWRKLRNDGFEVLPFARQVLGHVDPASKPEGRGRLSQDLFEVYRLSRLLAESHRGAVSAWELLNEPDNYYADTPDLSAAWQKAQYLGLRRGDLAAPVTRPPVGFSPGLYWEQTIRNGLWDYGEANNVHFYGWASAFEDVLAQHRWLDEWGSANGYTQIPSAPLWVTEINRDVGDYTWRSPEAIWADQAGFWQTVVPMAEASEVAVFTPYVAWWARQPEFSLFDEDLKPTPAWEAYVAAIAATKEMEAARESTPEMEDGRSEMGGEGERREGRDGSPSRPPRIEQLAEIGGSRPCEDLQVARLEGRDSESSTDGCGEPSLPSPISDLPSSAKPGALLPAPLILQWVADESTTTPNKYAGTYRALRVVAQDASHQSSVSSGQNEGEQAAVGSGQVGGLSPSETPFAGTPASESPAWQPIRGELRIYNFSNERVRGRLQIEVLGNFGAKIGTTDHADGTEREGGGSCWREGGNVGRYEGRDGSPSRPPRVERFAGEKALPRTNDEARDPDLWPPVSDTPRTQSAPSSRSSLLAPHSSDDLVVFLAPFSSVTIPIDFAVLGDAEVLTYKRGVFAGEFFVDSHEAVIGFQPRADSFALWPRRFPRRTALGERDFGGVLEIDFEARSLLAFGLETTPSEDLFEPLQLSREMDVSESIRLRAETPRMLAPAFDPDHLPIRTDESREAIHRQGLISWPEVRDEARALQEDDRWEMGDGSGSGSPDGEQEAESKRHEGRDGSPSRPSGGHLLVEGGERPSSAEDGRWKLEDGRSGALPRAYGEEGNPNHRPPLFEAPRTQSAPPPRSSLLASHSSSNQAPPITIAPLLCTPSGALDVFYGEDFTPGYVWTSQAGPWSGINGMELRSAETVQGNYELFEFTVSSLEGDRKFPRAVARIEGGLPPDTVIFLRASRWFNQRPFDVKVFLIDRWGQAWSIAEQMVLQPHLRAQNKYLPLRDFSHSYFSNLIPGHGLHPDEIVEIQLSLPIMEIPEDEAVKLLLGFLRPLATED